MENCALDTAHYCERVSCRISRNPVDANPRFSGYLFLYVKRSSATTEPSAPLALDSVGAEQYHYRYPKGPTQHLDLQQSIREYCNLPAHSFITKGGKRTNLQALK